MAIKQKSTKKTYDRKKNLIAYFSSDSRVAEQYRTIKTNIQYKCSEQNIRTILITSPCDGEGKSTTATNLAISMAQQNERVLLIDANLRNPTVHLTFKIPNSTGLTSILNGLSSLDEAINQTEIGRLDVLPSGPSTFFPAELLASESLKELLLKTMGNYDYVLIDSPSILKVADPKILANKCDGVILVLNPGKSKLENAEEAKSVLEFVNSQVLGVVFNKR